MVCPNCGKSIEDDSRFCGECGARLEAEAGSETDAFYGYEPGQMRLAPGYSRRLDSDAVLAALKKQRRSTRIVGLIVIFLPLPFEKYDKSRDEEIPCLFCGRMNPVKNDNCTFCHNPMIK